MLIKEIRKHLKGINFPKLMGFILNSVEADPDPLVPGLFWYNQTSKQFKIYDETSIKILNEVGSSGSGNSNYLGTKRFYVGLPPYPVTPQIGDIWIELVNINDSDRFVNSWIYEDPKITVSVPISPRWVSQNDKTFNFSALPSTTASHAPIFNYSFHSTYLINPHDFFFSRMETCVQSSIASTASNYTAWTFSLLNPLGAATILASDNNSTHARPANEISKYTTNIQQFVDVSATTPYAFRLNDTRVGSSATRSVAYSINYREVRAT